MRILLDAKDLIDIVECGQPLGVRQFDDYLRSHNFRLVLSFASITEFVAPLSRHGNFLNIRPLLQQIETLPVCYIREPPILIEEIKAAIHAFEARTEPEAVNPYVKRWDETFRDPSKSAAAQYINFRLDEIVFRLWRGQRNIFAPLKSQGQRLRQIIEEDRKLPDRVRRNPSKRFENTVSKHLRQWSIPPPKEGLQKFCRWAYSDPSRCPALRLVNLTFHELVANIGDAGQNSDIPDFGYINAIPYVGAVTLDRRIFDYCRRASRKLRTMNPRVNYQEAMYPNVRTFMHANP